MYNKSEFITHFANKGYTKSAAEVIVRDFLDSLTEAMVVEGGVQFVGFGTFGVRDSVEKRTMDYQSQKVIVVPGHKAPKFTPGKLLKRAVRDGIVRE